MFWILSVGLRVLRQAAVTGSLYGEEYLTGVLGASQGSCALFMLILRLCRCYI